MGGWVGGYIYLYCFIRLAGSKHNRPEDESLRHRTAGKDWVRTDDCSEEGDRLRCCDFFWV